MESAEVCLALFAPSDKLYWFQRQPLVMDTWGGARGAWSLDVYEKIQTRWKHRDFNQQDLGVWNQSLYWDILGYISRQYTVHWVQCIWMCATMGYSWRPHEYSNFNLRGRLWLTRGWNRVSIRILFSVEASNISVMGIWRHDLGSVLTNQGCDGIVPKQQDKVLSIPDILLLHFCLGIDY